MADYASRWLNKGKRAVRIANCSGARGDPGYQMKRQVELGDVDFITGDYLAEMNMAEHAEAYRQGKHPGYEPFAWQGLQQTLELAAEKKVKIIINGGSLNPRGLAEECQKLSTDRNLGLSIAFVSGDDFFDEIKACIKAKTDFPAHLDADNKHVAVNAAAARFAHHPSADAVVSANAYLGGRAIVRGLEAGADVILCGRVADASPVIAAAMYWHGWQDTDYDHLAQALVAGHLIECSAYVTGSNFAAFYEVDPVDRLIDLPFPIVEIAADGAATVCKHDNTKGLVTKDTVTCQLLYELQGNLYMNSDVCAILDDVKVEEVAKDRVRVTGVRGRPPSPTTKLAIFFKGGYESQILLNATGYATAQKWALFERQIRYALAKHGCLDKFALLQFQIVGTNAPNPRSQLQSTTYCRLFSQADAEDTVLMALKVVQEFGMQHFSGYHVAFDMRTALPIPFYTYYPAKVAQDSIPEAVHLLDRNGAVAQSIDAGHPPRYQDMPPRANYETAAPVADIAAAFGPTVPARLGDIVLARSGDKGGNLNIGLFVRAPAAWPWLQSFLTHDRIKQLVGDDWSDDFYLERVEFPHLHAVHFVIYGILGAGVSSSSRLDNLGKGFADFIRDRVVDVPVKFLEGNKRAWAKY